MLTTPKPIGALLPKGWPSRVRSAVVHAISMSNVVFAVTRGHAENHFNARVRLQAENDRLRREVSLLTEELRIKDSRMERIPPPRRPHYPPVDLAILQLRAARGWSLAETARRLLVTPLTDPPQGEVRIGPGRAPRNYVAILVRGVSRDPVARHRSLRPSARHN